MKKMLMLIGLMCLISVSVGCRTYKFDNFVTTPSKMVGYGIDNAWMWVDASEYGNELAKNGVNITSIEVFGCGPDKNTWPKTAVDSNRGYWMESSRWNTVKDHLDDFLDEMKKRKITVNVTLTGWNYRGGCPDPQNGGKPSTICSARFNNVWFQNAMNYFAKRGTDGIILTASSEPYGGKNTECYSKFDQWTAQLNASWSGMKGWNKGSRPKTAPAGYFVIYHSSNQNDMPPKNGIELTDSPVGATIFTGASAETAVINTATVGSYVKKIKAAGCGFIAYGYPFTLWNIDKNGIKAIGEAGK